MKFGDDNLNLCTVLVCLDIKLNFFASSEKLGHEKNTAADID